jgi:hypothetical protein
MPTKKETITDAERAKRIREAAREHETSNDPKDFERAFGKVAKAALPASRNPERK